MASLVEETSAARGNDDEVLCGSGLDAAVRDAVYETEVVDVHTHLFPHTHADLYCWGIDALLTYHYLVSEFFMNGVAPESVTHESFAKMSTREQADLVWEHLFVRRSPFSEACRGVLTTLTMLGLSDAVKSRDLGAIRAWFDAWKGREKEYTEHVFSTAGVKYAVMTNIPYVPAEAAHWRPEAAKKTYGNRFRSALRVDWFLMGGKNHFFSTVLPEVWNWKVATGRAEAIESSAAANLGGGDREETVSLEDCKEYLRDWAKVMKPEYMIASTPAAFAYPANPRLLSYDTKCQIGKSEHFQSERIARLAAAGGCLFDKVLLPVCEELGLALTIKVGACRGESPNLCFCGGGDGIAPSTMNFPSKLAAMCRDWPKVKFLATVLARRDQHELAVVAQKFRNLHVYGCWWYCNQPSVIEETVRLRLEMLGSAFTAQHSDCRVLEQLLYKWKHSREVIIKVVTEQLKLLHQTTAWELTRGEVKRTVRSLLGGQYETFLAQEL